MTLAREIGDRKRISSVLQNLGILEQLRGDYSQAEVYLQESLAITQEIDHRRLISETLCEWGELRLKQQKLDLASPAYEQALTTAQKMNALPIEPLVIY